LAWANKKVNIRMWAVYCDFIHNRLIALIRSCLEYQARYINMTESVVFIADTWKLLCWGSVQSHHNTIKHCNWIFVTVASSSTGVC